MTIIYGLCDPRTGHLRYIGKTSQSLKTRMQAHLSRAHRGVQGHKNNWIRQLQALGLVPEVFEVETVPGDGVEEEIYHIAQFKAIGCDLTNMTDGGEAFLGHKHTSEHRAKISASLRGQKRSPETKARMSAAMKGKPKSEAHKLALSERHVSNETRAKISAIHKGKVMSAESRAKMSASRRGVTKSPETCAKIAESQRKRAAERAARQQDRHGTTWGLVRLQVFYAHQ